MPVSVVQVANGQSCLNGTITATLAVAPTEGNILVAFGFVNDTSFDVAPALSGWTSGPTAQGYDATQYGGPGGAVQIGSFYRPVAAGDSASWSFNPNTSGTDCAAIVLVELSGAEGTPVTTAIADTITSAAAADITIAGGGLLLGAWALQRTGYAPADAVTPGAGTTELADYDAQTLTASGQAAPWIWVGTSLTGTVSATISANPNLNKWGRGAVGLLFRAPAGGAIALDVYQINAPGDSITYLATLDDATERSIRIERNGTGSGLFVLNRHSAHATAAILAPGNLVKVRVPEIGAEPIFSFFLEQGDFRLVSSDEQGGELITIGGRGALSYTDRAVWLSSKFVVPWWPSTMGTPPAGTRGAVQFAAGTYRRYTVAGGVITGYANFTTTGFSAYFDARQTYQWPSANSKRFLVHLTTTEDPAAPDYTGYYVHPHQSGVTETLPSYASGTSTTVLLSDISPDKPGAVLYRMWQEATNASRPVKPIPLMTVDFTATTDSTGAAWSTTAALAGMTAELGETFLDTIAKLVSTGVIDVEMGPNLDLHAYNSRGVNRSAATFAASKVRFVKGVNIADDLSRERDDLPVATWKEVVGLEGVVGQVALADAATRVARESAGTGDSNVEATLQAIGLADLNARLVRSDAVGFAIATGTSELTGLYLPGPVGSTNGKFWPGDTVRVHTGTGNHDFNEQDLRVAAVTVSEDEAGNLDVTLEVGSVLGEAERRLYAGAAASSLPFATRSQYGDGAVAETAHPDLATHDELGLATDAELTTHASAADPHPAYQRESEKGAASGYAPLDSGILVPIAYLPTGTSGATVALGNHGHAHSALTGIGADDHHARAHDHSAAGDGATLAPGTFTVPGGGKLSAGSSFPVSPTSGDRCWRTDRALDYYYDGTRWLTTAMYTTPFSQGDQSNPATVDATLGRLTTFDATSDYWIVRFSATTYSVTNDASNFWTVILRKATAGGANTPIASFTTAADTAANYVKHDVSVGALLGGSSTYKTFLLAVEKTGSAGSLFATGVVAYRLVG